MWTFVCVMCVPLLINFDYFTDQSFWLTRHFIRRRTENAHIRQFRECCIYPACLDELILLFFGGNHPYYKIYSSFIPFFWLFSGASSCVSSWIAAKLQLTDFQQSDLSSLSFWLISWLSFCRDSHLQIVFAEWMRNRNDETLFHPNVRRQKTKKRREKKRSKFIILVMTL